jgi:hypothetical protein
MTETYKTYEQMTDAERKAFRDEEQAREARIHQRARQALQPYADLMCEMMSDSQRWAVERVLYATVKAADYFAKHELNVAVKVDLSSRGRKGSPWSTWMVDVKVSPKNDKDAIICGAMSFAHIGKRGAVKGKVYDHSIGGRTSELR